MVLTVNSLIPACDNFCACCFLSKKQYLKILRVHPVIGIDKGNKITRCHIQADIASRRDTCILLIYCDNSLVFFCILP